MSERIRGSYDDALYKSTFTYLLTLHSHPELIMGDRVNCLLEVHKEHTERLLVLACLVH